MPLVKLTRIYKVEEGVYLRKIIYETKPIVKSNMDMN